jgi:hypothetical protein
VRISQTKEDDCRDIGEEQTCFRSDGRDGVTNTEPGVAEDRLSCTIDIPNLLAYYMYYFCSIPPATSQLPDDHFSYMKLPSPPLPGVSCPYLTFQQTDLPIYLRKISIILRHFLILPPTPPQSLVGSLWVLPETRENFPRTSEDFSRL